MTLDGLFAKHLPKDIRGSLNGLYYLCGGIGMILFSKIAGILYDSVGPIAPFMMISLMDATFGFIVIILYCCGKFKV